MAIRFSYDTGTFEIGRYRGAPINLSVMFFLSALALAFPFWRMANLRGLVLTVLFLAVFFASILIHELAHARVATRFRVGVARIELNVLGGLVHLRGVPRRWQQDFLITLAGPSSNLALGLTAMALLLLVMPSPIFGSGVAGSDVLVRYEEPNVLALLLRATAYLNIGLCVVNLLPGIPLDGGRLLYLLVERRWNARIAMLTVSALGTVFALLTGLLLLGSLLLGCPIWAPPAFGTNWAAFKAARRGSRLRWDTVAS